MWKKIIEDAGLKIASDVKIADDAVVLDQVPKSGASLIEGGTVRVYTSTDGKKDTTTVPDVRSSTVAKAISKLEKSGLNIKIVGNGNAIIQDTSPGEIVTKGSIITVKFVDTTDLH